MSGSTDKTPGIISLFLSLGLNGSNHIFFLEYGVIPLRISGRVAAWTTVILSYPAAFTPLSDNDEISHWSNLNYKVKHIVNGYDKKLTFETRLP